MTEQNLPATQQAIGTVQVAEGAALHAEDQTLPIIQLVQATSLEGQPGMLRRMDTGEQFPALHVIPLAVQPTRTKFPEGDFNRDRKPECWSDDGLHASTRQMMRDDQIVMAMKAGQPCDECEFRATYRQEGMCEPGYAVLLMTPENEAVMVRLASFNTKLGRVFAATGHLRKAWMALGTRQEKSDKGSWWQLTLTAHKPADDAEVAVANDLYAGFRGRMTDQPDPATAEVPEAPAEPTVASTEGSAGLGF